MPTPIPTSTYRLHLTGAFTLADAADLVDHVDDLGADWLYASPIQTVPAGATHGYHILDPDTVNPELGGEAALQALHRALADRDRGLLLDIVPNHMAASPENPWWADLLRHGRASAHAATFDVGFDDPTGRLSPDAPDAVEPPPGGYRPDALVLPVLDPQGPRPLPEAQVQVDVEAGCLVVGGGLRLPLAPGTDPTAPLEEVLAAQHYRLLPWPDGAATINWRRFFAVNELVGVRVEDPAVFDATHRLIARLVDDGIVHGLRVDHIDGLVDPAGYLQHLRDLVGPATYVLVEKILETGEDLRPWPIAGTTGYEVATLLAAWQVSTVGATTLREALAERTGVDAPVADQLVAAKAWALRTLFPAEVARIVGMLHPLVERPREEVRRAVRALLAAMHGYRTYARPAGPLEAADRTTLAAARDRAVAGHPDEAEVLSAVHDALIGPDGRAALLRVQQLSGPATAKGFEDRLLYRAVALASLCEVGADPTSVDHPPSPEDVVPALAARQATWPHAGTTTSTHDTKRSEDVRSRITALAEVPGAVADLHDRLRASRPMPTPEAAASRWLLVQMVLGTWGLVDVGPALHDRLHDYARKAVEEAGWPDPPAVLEVLEADLADLLDGGLTGDVSALADRIAVPGAVNSLSLVALKMVGPGVVDVYRGTEVWDDSTVDPDNRRPLRVPHLRSALARAAATTTALDRPAAVADLRTHWRDGAVKALVTRQGLHLRRDHPATFLDGPVDAPAVQGPHAAHVMVLRRRSPDGQRPDGHGPGGATTVLGIGTRLPLALADGAWPVGAVWGDTAVQADPGVPLTDVLTGRTLDPSSGWLSMAEVLADLPVAMLVGHAQD